MTKMEIMDALKAMDITFDKKAKKAVLESLYNENVKTFADENVNTFADEFISDNELSLESILSDRAHNVIRAHGGFAIKRDRRRVCEVAQNKRTNLYKVAFHKATYERAKILLNDYYCEEQKLNYVVRDLDMKRAFKLVEILDSKK